jgi:hypothetical protein
MCDRDDVANLSRAHVRRGRGADDDRVTPRERGNEIVGHKLEGRRPRGRQALSYVTGGSGGACTTGAIGAYVIAGASKPCQKAKR